ncbi:MAG TPA: hypothetical protein DIU15_14650, partial [Deltaproteobacteria bacterium]|nr:hypothetical protein [Deltaproteobacteria bacterium]
PPLHRWLVGKAPALRISWGPKQYELRPDGVLSGRRDGDGWRDNPRSNYNDRFDKRRTRGADGTAAAEQEEASSSPKATPKGKRRKTSGKSAARKRKPAPVPENGGGRPTSGSS